MNESDFMCKSVWIIAVCCALLLTTSCSSNQSTEQLEVLFTVDNHQIEIMDAPAAENILTGKIDMELQNRILEGGSIEVLNESYLDLNQDGTGECIRLETADIGYLLYVGDRVIEGFGENPINKIYAVSIPQSGYIQILIGGGSPFDYSDIYCYENNRLWKMGSVSSLPEDIKLTDTGFSARKRGDTVQTWFHTVDYVDCKYNALRN